MVELFLLATLFLLVGLIMIYFWFYLDNHHSEMVGLFDEMKDEIKYLHDKVDYLHQKSEKLIKM